jgi:vacuolar-type H+-ATPase subunit H
MFVGAAGATYLIKRQIWAAKLAEWKEKKDNMLDSGRQEWDERKERISGRGRQSRDKVS